jgi:RNA polymerase sigma-70 factor (ECF subfamily)
MYLDGYKYKEIADTINIKLGTVKNRIFQARKEMMDRLQ